MASRRVVCVVVALIGAASLPSLTGCDASRRDAGGEVAVATARPDVERAIRRLEGGDDGVYVRRSRRTGLARFVAVRRGKGFALSSPRDAPAEPRARAFLAEHGAAFGLGERPEARLLRVVPRDELGLEHVRVQQLHRGVPVTGAELVVHLAGDRVRAASGHTLDVADLGALDVTPAVSAVAAQDIAAGVVREVRGAAAPEPVAAQLEVFNHGIFDDNKAPSRLAWFVQVRAPGVLEYVWVDAREGSVLLHFDQASHALNRVISSRESGTPVVVRSEGQPPVPGDADVNDLYDLWKITHDFFLTRFERDGIDGAGQPLVGTVHDGGTGNAAWIPLDETFTFSDGWVADDVVAHEFTHGVIFHTAKLFNYMECGSLNESFSDMMGETVDLTDGVGNDAPAVRWRNGEDVPGGPTRSEMDPAMYGQPGRVGDPLYACGADDAWGEHHNSGVSNHAYALMADGGTYNGHSVRGIGLDKAVQVAYRAMTEYLTSASGFAEASDALQQACTDLVGRFGIVGDDCAQVRQALEAVEMPDARPCHSVLVRVRAAGTGSGQVVFFRNTKDAIPCEPAGACDQYVYEGTFQRLSATADPGSVFAGWRGPCTYPASPDCELRSITGDTVDLVAVFEPVGTTHPITVAIGTPAPGARITSSSGGIDCGTDCTEVATAGDSVTLTATASAGHGPVRWRGDCSGVGPRCLLAASGPMSVTVDFGPIPYSPAQDFHGTPGLGGSAAWGDYDGDGDLDLVVLTAGSSAFSTLYQNAGGTLSDSGTALVALQWSATAAWGDLDNDGDLDLAVQGVDPAYSSVLEIYRNDGGVLVDAGMALPPLDGVSGLTWVDYDNDGDLDLAMGHLSVGPSARSWILRNDHGTLVDSGIALPAAVDWRWGDYDGDGRLDLLALRESADGTTFTSRLYQNEGGTLADTGTVLDVPGAFAATWVDYDGDGHLDLALDSGELLHNQGGTLVKVASTLEAGPGTPIAWADADANGHPDLLVFEAGGSNAVLYLNQAGAFSPTSPTDEPMGHYSTSAWGDHDGDGRLDVFVHPEDVLYRSSLGAVNTAPQPPGSTSVLQSAAGARLMWAAGSDAQTPAAALTYNVRVGTTPNGSEVVSAMADPATGRRLLPQAGNAGLNRFLLLEHLAPGTYYWSVQSIDTSFAGSPFRVAGSFSTPPAVSATVSVTSDAGASYCADITVTNISSATVNGWQTGVVLPGGSAVTITSLTNFQYTRDGAVVSLQPRWFNRTLTPGQSVTGRVCATGSTGATYVLQVLKNGLGDGYVSASPIGVECGSSCSARYPGGTVTLTATPAYGSTFLRWDGACTGSAPTCTVTMGPGGAAVTAWFMPDTSGGVTVTPVVAQRQLYFNEEQVRITNPSALTALSITVVIQRTTGITFNGHYNTVGSQIQQGHTTGASTITYRFSLAAGQTVSPGTWTFAAQTNGTGTPHPTGGDTYSVTYTTGGQTFTRTGTF